MKEQLVKTEFEKPIRLKKAHWLSDDAVYFVSGRKTPVAFSTVADLESLRLLDEEFGGLRNLANAINENLVIVSQEEIDIIEVLLSYGETSMK